MKQQKAEIVSFLALWHQDLESREGRGENLSLSIERFHQALPLYARSKENREVLKTYRPDICFPVSSLTTMPRTLTRF